MHGLPHSARHETIMLCIIDSPCRTPILHHNQLQLCHVWHSTDSLPSSKTAAGPQATGSMSTPASWPWLRGCRPRRRWWRLLQVWKTHWLHKTTADL